ncbi:hypothetical protein GF389_03500 [Candidatus Dojkabacteria bacterium]|nr:hypothetical protein [Candidatus Dojkabacteria bacterium]
MKHIYRVITVLILSGLAIFNVRAQSILPESIGDFLDEWEGSTVTEKVVGFLRLALTLAFGAVILVAVLYSILAAIKYIRSQGDSGQVEEANNAIKAIFQGIAAMFVGFIGIIIVFFIFDVALPDPSLPAVCVKCPNSSDCRVCSEGERKTDNNGTSFYDLPPYQPLTEDQCDNTYGRNVEDANKGCP